MEKYIYWYNFYRYIHTVHHIDIGTSAETVVTRFASLTSRRGRKLEYAFHYYF